MPPKADTEPPPSISNDQISLLIRVCERAQSTFTHRDWQDIASKEGDSAEANRQRFNYLMHKINAVNDYNNGRETAEYKPAAKSTKKSGAKRAPSAPLEEDEEQMGEYRIQKPTPRLVLRHGAKKAKTGDEKN